MVDAIDGVATEIRLRFLDLMPALILNLLKDNNINEKSVNKLFIDVYICLESKRCQICLWFIVSTAINGAKFCLNKKELVGVKMPFSPQTYCYGWNNHFAFPPYFSFLKHQNPLLPNATPRNLVFAPEGAGFLGFHLVCLTSIMVNVTILEHCSHSHALANMHLIMGLPVPTLLLHSNFMMNPTYRHLILPKPHSVDVLITDEHNHTDTGRHGVSHHQGSCYTGDSTVTNKPLLMMYEVC